MTKRNKPKLTKVFIVLPDYDYEGYGKPEGAYLTKKEAKAAVKAAQEATYHGREIHICWLGRSWRP